MNEQILNTTIEVFSSLEKWNAFLEIQSYLEKDVLIKHWLTVGAKKLQDLFNERPSLGWIAEKWDNEYEIRWHIAELESESIGIGFGYPAWEFHLHFKEHGKFDQTKAVDLLQTPEFQPLKSKFPESVWKDGCFACNKTFNPYSPKRERDRMRELAWYAAHQRDDFAEKMLLMVREITDNTELTGLVIKLNQESMR